MKPPPPLIDPAAAPEDWLKQPEEERTAQIHRQAHSMNKTARRELKPHDQAIVAAKWAKRAAVKTLDAQDYAEQLKFTFRDLALAQAAIMNKAAALLAPKKTVDAD